MTDSVYYVNTASSGGDGTGGINVLSGGTAAFSSLSSAELALGRTVGEGDTVTIKCKGSDSTPDGYVLFNGWTINGNLIIESDESSRHDGVWNPNAYTIGNATESYGVRINETNITLRKMQFSLLNPVGQSLIYLAFGNDKTKIYENIFRSDVNFDTDNSVLKVSHSGMTVLMERNLFIQFKQLISDSAGSGEAVTLNGNTIIDVQRIYTTNKTNKPILTNNIIFDSSEGITGSVSPLSDYNATNASDFGEDYTANANDLVNQTIDFVDAPNKDYRIVSTSPLKTAGSDGGQIGAFYEESAGTGVTTDVDIELSAPLFNVIASAGLPEPVSTVNVELSAPLFNVSATTELPQPIANINASILGPLFSVESNVELPLPVANISTEINAPLFSISTSTGLPQPVSNVSIELLPPKFSIDASAELPEPQSNVSIGISQPTFSISATSEALAVSMDVSVDINAPTFSVNAETTIPTFSTVSFDVGNPLFIVKSSVTIPDAIANINMLIGRPSFNVTMQISGVNIVIPKTGASITYNPSLNTLTYYVDRNSLTYDPKSNSIKY